jgi:tRNA modification GTPase
VTEGVDTIAAVATPPGRGGIGIVRLSGPGAHAILEVLTGRPAQPRRILVADFLDAAGQAIDSGVVLCFRGPASFTGEDVAEFQGHGGPVVMALLLERCLELGARAARPGEFTERAFLNDKLSLAQAEAVADLIDSGTAAAARGAMRSLKGEFADRVHALAEAVVALRVYVEAAIDFPDEDVDFLEDGVVAGRVEALQHDLEALLDVARQGVRLNKGLRIALVGKPNAGKSTLFNLLLREDRAIVTDLPGTTRDLLSETVDIGGLACELVDTAGLRDSEDPVEREGVRRARDLIAGADLVLLLVDAAQGACEREAALAAFPELPNDRTIVVFNKTDMRPDVPGFAAGSGCVALSARTGAGRDGLEAAILAAVGAEAAPEFTARERHVDALRRALTRVQAGRAQLEHSGSGELLAEDLRAAHAALGEIHGAMTADELLGAIFGSFCIGK